MFFLFGIRRRPKVVAVTPEIECQRCNNMVAYALVREKKWFTLNFVPIIPLMRRHSLVCTICTVSKELTKKEFKDMTAGESQ